ncbi:hypothetical protein [Vibrio parahaemolyticus]|uniref:hypothetical protein n=1 Tax=Vibrio parahaemolyticus TaxID=670 RepID=UPI0011212409|nr:hypothetical protein [Vibrio parahaemolyticus]TOF62790.1 hypothetical protein CGJ19_22420 [Vibrio parahaemolyticus]
MTKFLVEFSTEDFSGWELPIKPLKKFDWHDYEYDGEIIESVDLRKIVGTSHCNYYGKTWAQLIPKVEDEYYVLKRANQNLEDLAHNPTFYLPESKPLTISLAKLDNNYYILNGNHRSIIGCAFLLKNDLPPILHDISVSVYSHKVVQSPQTPLEIQESTKEPNKVNMNVILFALLIIAIWLVS